MKESWQYQYDPGMQRVFKKLTTEGGRIHPGWFASEVDALHAAMDYCEEQRLEAAERYRRMNRHLAQLLAEASPPVWAWDHPGIMDVLLLEGLELRAETFTPQGHLTRLELRGHITAKRSAEAERMESRCPACNLHYRPIRPRRAGPQRENAPSAGLYFTAACRPCDDGCCKGDRASAHIQTMRMLLGARTGQLIEWSMYQKVLRWKLMPEELIRQFSCLPPTEAELREYARKEGLA